MEEDNENPLFTRKKGRTSIYFCFLKASIEQNDSLYFLLIFSCFFSCLLKKLTSTRPFIYQDIVNRNTAIFYSLIKTNSFKSNAERFVFVNIN